jgi:hypothetical protein
VAEYSPSKFTKPADTVAGQAAVLLDILDGQPLSVGQLYLRYRSRTSRSYDTFALALTFLYGAGALDLDGQIVRTT